MRPVAKPGLSGSLDGGEPFLDPQGLEQIVETACSCGVAIDYVETNSAWYIDEKKATAILKALSAAGLEKLLISISPFHNEFIPFKKVKGVIDIGRKLGYSLFPWKSDFIKDLSQFDDGVPHGPEAFIEQFGHRYLETVLNRYWIHLGGRAIDTFRPVLRSTHLSTLLRKQRGGCAAALSDTSHFHIDLYGNYIPGLCSGLAIPHTLLGAPLKEEDFPILHILAVSGVKGLMRFAEERFNISPKRDAYLNACDLCSELRTGIVHARPHTFRELEPEGFYGGDAH